MEDFPESHWKRIRNARRGHSKYRVDCGVDDLNPPSLGKGLGESLLCCSRLKRLPRRCAAALCGFGRHRVAFGTVLGASQRQKVQSATLIQRVYRGSLVRREIRGIVDDGTVVVNREELVRQLSSLAASRISLLHLLGYMCTVFFLVFYLTAITFLPGTGYNHAGIVKDAILAGDSSDSINFSDIRRPGHIWQFINNNVVGQVENLKGNYHGEISNITAIPPYFYLLDDVIVVQRRGYSTPCSHEDSIYTSLLPDLVDCPLPLADGDNVLDYGNTTSTQDTFGSLCYFAHAEQRDKRFFSDNSTECPRNVATDVLGNFGGAEVVHFFVLPVSRAQNGSVWTRLEDYESLVNLANRCDWIDGMSRQITIDITALSGHPKPIGVMLQFSIDIDISGKLTPSYTQLAVDLSLRGPGFYAAVGALIFFTTLGVFANCLDCVWWVHVTQWRRYFKRFLGDFWNYHSMAHYAILYAYAIFILEIDEKTAGVRKSATEDEHTDYRRHILALNGIMRTWWVIRGLATAMTVMKLLMYGRHNGMFSVLTRTVRAIGMKALHFVVCLILIIISFTMMGWSLFGEGVAEYSTFDLAVTSCLQAMFGSFDFVTIQAFNEPGSKLFFWPFMIVVTLILVNFFVAIMLEGYEKATQDITTANRFEGEVLEMAVGDLQWIQRDRVSYMALIWMLTHDVRLSTRRYIALCDIKLHLPALMTHECLVAVCHVAAKSSNLDPEEIAARVFSRRYRMLSAPLPALREAVKLPFFLQPFHFICVSIGCKRSRRRYRSGSERRHPRSPNNQEVHPFHVHTVPEILEASSLRNSSRVVPAAECATLVGLSAGRNEHIDDNCEVLKFKYEGVIGTGPSLPSLELPQRCTQESAGSIQDSANQSLSQAPCSQPSSVRSVVVDIMPTFSPSPSEP